jgi:hypothetical protein
MKGIGKYVVVALIVLVVGAFLSSKFFDNREPEIKIERDTISVPEIDSTRVKFLEEELKKAKAKKEKVTIKVPVPVVQHDTVYTDSSTVVTTKYTGSEVLNNGTINYEIYADSLHAYNFTLETENQIIKETITKTLPPKSALFLGGGVNINDGIQSAEIGLMYNRRQKWQVGVVVNQDLSGLLSSGKQTSVGVRAYIKL